MKTRLILALTILLVLCVAGTALAGPFSDVPANHWSYDAIAKLASAGIIQGDQGRYQGDKTMTRYEMAQIVARAMERSDKADAQNKALINKLSDEFAAELTSLGVRVAKLEANQPNLTFKGSLLLRLDTTTTYDDHVDKPAGVNPSQYRLRLDSAAKVDDNTTANFRIVTNSPYAQTVGAYGLPPNNNMVNLGSGTNTNGSTNFKGQYPNLQIDRVNIVTKFADGITATMGRQAMTNGDNLLIADANYYSFDGIKVAGNIAGVDSFVEYGRFLNTSNNTWVNTVVEFSKPITPNLKLGTGYFEMKDTKWHGQAYAALIPNNAVSYAADSYSFGRYALQNWYLYTIYNMGPNAQLAAEYTRNGAEYARAHGNNSAFDVFLRFGDLALNKPGQQKYQIFFYRAGANSLGLSNEGANNSAGLTNFDATATTTYFTDLDFGYWYAFSKNFNFEAHYVKLHDYGNTTPSNNYHYTRVALNVLF
ncbi:MAG: S-layer homology domain-containing protein [Negativicutes bacterium]|nr:S-layer homology domain-containing protein [Negativicutes bacterium]